MSNYKPLNVASFIEGQTRKKQERRVSTFMKYIDGTPLPTFYLNINSVTSTVEHGMRSADEYVGKDSPVRYDYIDNMPIYKLPPLSDFSDFDDEQGMTNSISGTGTILPNTITPRVGDLFIVKGVPHNYVLVVDNVTMQPIVGREAYLINWHADRYSKWTNALHQVEHKFTALFDNIGLTDERVVIRNDDLETYNELKSAYEECVNDYVERYSYKGILGFPIVDKLTDTRHDFMDVLLIEFLKRTRIVIMDQISRKHDVFSIDTYSTKRETIGREFRNTIFQQMINKKKGPVRQYEAITMMVDVSPLVTYRSVSNTSLTYSTSYVEDADEVAHLTHTIDHPLSELFKYINDYDGRPRMSVPTEEEIFNNFQLVEDNGEIRFEELSKIDGRPIMIPPTEEEVLDKFKVVQDGKDIVFVETNPSDENNDIGDDIIDEEGADNGDTINNKDDEVIPEDNPDTESGHSNDEDINESTSSEEQKKPSVKILGVYTGE